MHSGLRQESQTELYFFGLVSSSWCSIDISKSVKIHNLLTNYIYERTLLPLYTYKGFHIMAGQIKIPSVSFGKSISSIIGQRNTNRYVAVSIIDTKNSWQQYHIFPENLKNWVTPQKKWLWKYQKRETYCQSKWCHFPEGDKRDGFRWKFHQFGKGVQQQAPEDGQIARG